MCFPSSSAGFSVSLAAPSAAAATGERLWKREKGREEPRRRPSKIQETGFFDLQGRIVVHRTLNLQCTEKFFFLFLKNIVFKKDKRLKKTSNAEKRAST